MDEVVQLGPNRFGIGADWVEVSRVGTDLELQGQKMHLNSEMLAQPMCISIFLAQGIDNPAVPLSRVKMFVDKTLTAAGYFIDWVE